MEINYTSRSPEQTRNLGRRLALKLWPGAFIGLGGDLGAGKTCFAQGLGAGLGITELINSPTFTLIKEYQGRLPLYHMDVYRLGHWEEMYDLGYEEYFGGSGVVLVEWFEQISEILPEDRLEINFLRGESENIRILQFKPQGSKWEALFKGGGVFAGIGD
ncbi:MAG: tRNA (adenosine(37)-N6)-threonylcarbamoyltransferase complex ATPase subunit type 1 TsaE [Clostridia bacterium]|nr:tRNA (adenosine(37)-N6)-threonylcarbamoyltransferase complex ATPase subunit type 1 TsaE [Clostridia bacterium]